jgi:hypothetical protein
MTLADHNHSNNLMGISKTLRYSSGAVRSILYLNGGTTPSPVNLREGNLVMKSIKLFAVAVALTAVTFGSVAAQLNTVTATSTTLDGLESTFAAKAAAAGATSYKIIEAGGQNQIHGTAILYK